MREQQVSIIDSITNDRNSGMKTSTPMTGWPTMKKNGSDNIANISMGDRNSLP